jgi:hypothetical protein
MKNKYITLFKKYGKPMATMFLNKNLFYTNFGENEFELKTIEIK